MKLRRLDIKRTFDDLQDTWRMLAGGDLSGGLTAVAVGIAKLGEPAVVAMHKEASSFTGTGRALSAAAGRLSYMHGLRVRPTLASCPERGCLSLATIRSPFKNMVWYTGQIASSDMHRLPVYIPALQRDVCMSRC